MGAIEAAAGETRSGLLPVPKGPDGETSIPVTLVNGLQAGPTLALVAGNHGYEYPPILASQRIAANVDARKLKGRLIIVHIANLPSFLKRTIYTSPIDGQNLNRVYPGKIDGTISYRIASVITREVIEAADDLIDLHCGDGNESLRPYSYWMPIGEPKVDELSRQLTLAFGMENIVIDRGRPKDPGASIFCSNTAVTRGKPATTIESGGMGIAYDEEAISRIEKGVANVMRYLHMIDGEAVMPAHPTWYDPTEVLRFPETLADKAGLFHPLVKNGQTVSKDALLGYVTDFFGKRIFELRSPFAGEVLYIIGTPPTSAGEPLAFIGAVKN